MKDIMGIINLIENEDRIKDLTHNRPIATIPILGRYRIIDFSLSNMVNAGIRNVGIYTRGKSQSLMDHLGTGKEWDLDRKIDGLFLLNPIIDFNNIKINKGDIESFRSHLNYLKSSRQRYVVISRSYMICNVDYVDAVNYHKETGADITIIYKKIEEDIDKFNDCDTLNLDKKENVISVGSNLGDKKSYNISMETYIMKKELLLNIIQNSINKGDYEYLKQAVFNSMKNLHVNAYSYNGYLSCISSVENYYRTNMELLNVDLARQLFYEDRLVYTKVKDEPPTKYCQNTNVSNSLIANGCVIEGVVENSVIGRRVEISKGAVVKDSIIMQKSSIGENCYLENVILDKHVRISDGKILSGDKDYPFVIKKNMSL